MVPLNGPMILVIGAIVLASIVVPPVVHVAKKVNHAICHVVTFGHHCK
jgi:hypothetical protein